MGKPGRSDSSKQDKFDRSFGLALVRSGKNSTARYVESQPQVQLELNIDRHITFMAIYAHFFAGQFLKETGAHKNVDYFTTWLTYKF